MSIHFFFPRLGWKETTDDLDEDIDNNYQLDTDADGNAFRRNNTQQSNDDKDQTNKEQQSLKEVNDVTQKFFKSMKASMSSKKTSSLNELLLDGCENSPSDSLGGSTSNRDYIGAVEDRDTAISFGQSLYKNVAMEGFLTKRSMSQKYSSKQWERVYVSITKNARLHYYKSRSEFRTNPKSHLNLRAIVLSEFKVVIVNSMLEANIDDQDDISVLTGDLNSSISDRNGKKFSDAENSSVVSDSRSGVSMRKTGTDTNRDVDEIIYRQRKRGSLFGSVVHDQSEDSKLSKKNLPIFEIKMIPRDEAEEFGFRLSETSRDSFTVKKSGSGNKKGRWLVWRCDTEEELNSWVLAIKSVCNECFL